MAKWLDKYEQGGMVLKQKTHDNYGKKPNPNDVQASVGPDFVGLGYNTKGRDYSPAWGGQFAMGGSIPGAVGFTYARTQDPAPSNGPYAKKTLASAQNGKKVDPNEKKYQAPDKNKIVDWFNNYYTSPFFKENLYDKGNAFMENVGDKLGKATAEKINNLNYTFKDVSSGGYYKGSSYDLENTVNMGNPNNYYNQSKSDVLSHELGHVNQDVILGQQPRNLAIMLNRNNQVNRKPLANEIYNIANEMPAKNTYGELQNPYLPSVGSYRADRLKNWVNDENLRSTGEFHDHVLGEVRGDIMALRYLASKEGIWDAAKNKPGSFTPEMLDKLYKSKNLNTPQVKKDSQGNITTNKPNPKSLKPNDLKNVAPPKKPGMILNRLREKYNDSDLLYLMNKLAKNEENAPMDKAQNGKEMSFYQNGLDWKPKTISKNGSVIKDDMGQWAHPGEVTEIGSNDITMQGVDYPVLGVSDTGDTQMMYPDQDYKFNGEKVTEFPMAQDGRNVPTTADSTRLYNSQIALNKFYENEMKAGRLKMSDIATIFDFNNYSGLNKDLNKANLNFYRGEIDRRSFKKEGIFDDEYKKMFNLSPEQVRQLEYKGLAQTKGSSEYQDYYRDIVTPMQNLASPFALIDKRIAPQRKISYSPVSLQDYPGGDVSVYDYDPILIKPVNALTPEERALRIKKYGKDSGIKETVSKPIQKPVSKPTPKPEPKSEPAPVVAQQPTPEKPTPQPKPLYEYEGEYVMAPTPGGGGGSMVGVKKKDGTIEYVKPEDYQRMGVPKYGQDYIKSKQKMQEGGWLSKYDNIPSGNNLKKQAEETIAKRNADRPTMSQYTPKKGEQVKFNKQKLQRIAEENAPLNRMATSQGAKNIQDASNFALNAMTFGEGALATRGLLKDVYGNIIDDAVKAGSNAVKGFNPTKYKTASAPINNRATSIFSELPEEFQTTDILNQLKSGFDAHAKRVSSEVAKRHGKYKLNKTTGEVDKVVSEDTYLDMIRRLADKSYSDKTLSEANKKFGTSFISDLSPINNQELLKGVRANYRKNKDGGWLDKYQDGGNINKKLKEEAEERLSTMGKPKSTISQYTPKPGEQAKFDKQKLERIAEDNAPLNRMAASKGAANMQDAALFALDAMTLGEGTLALKGLAKPVIKTLGKKLSSIPTSSRYITELENLGHVQTSGINKRAVQRIIDKEPSTSDVWLDTPTKEWNPEKFRIGVENEEGRTMINHPKGHTIKQNIKIENKGNYNEQTSRYYNISDNEGTGGITLDTKQHLGDPYVDINEINFFNRGKKLPSGKTSFNSSNEQMNIVFSHFPEKARIKPIDASIHSQPVMNARFAKLNSSQPGRIEIKPEYIDPLNKITHVQNPEPIDWYNETIEQFPKIKRTNQTLNEYTKAGLKEPFIRYKGKPISFEEFNTPQMKALFENPHTSSQAYDASDIMVNKYKTIKNWKNGGWLNKYK